MNIISIIFALLCLYSRVSSHDQEENPLLSNEQFMVEYNSASIYFVETFNNKGAIFSSWITSQALKATEDGGTLKYDGDWILEEATKDALPNDLGLTFNEKAKHRAISSKLLKDFVFEEKPFILQYEVLHQDGQECGGAYIKLLSMQRNEKPLSDFNDKTPYTIMFGPDKCGALNRLHFIFRHQNPLNGSFEEKHCRTPKSKIDETFTDAKPHLFQLIIRPDNTYEVAVDHKVISYGSLLKDFTPPVNPPSEIDDPSDQKPSNWDDREKIYDPSAEKPKDWNEDAPYQIPDPNAVKPNDWLDDEPVNIRDPSAEKPDDWDNEMDGDWEAPLVPNPACEEVSGCGPWSSPLINNPEYKGKWVPPLINNPDFKGVWTPRKIPNPDYFVDNNPFRMSPIEAVGFELWSMSAKIMFDNIIITDDEIIANRFAALTFDRKINFIAASAETIWAKMMASLNHKPGWWSLYFFYCFIPIAIYVWYLWRRVKEDSLLNQFIGFTNHYPWLWALYVVILLIPVTLVVVCCFWTTKDTEAEHKKDDNKSKETDSFSNKSLPIDREIITDDKLIEKEEKSSEDNEYEKIKNDTSEEPPHSNGNDDEDDETSGNMEISNGVTENEPEIILKQRKPHSNIH